MTNTGPSKCMRHASKVLLRLGQILLTFGVICFTVSIGTAYWVIRPIIDLQRRKINPNKTLVIQNYGIFVACRQSGVYTIASGDCGSLLDNLNFINNGTARYIQLVMCLAVLLYTVSLSLEVVQCVPTKRFRNFIAENRIVELFAGIASVMALQGMVIFAGEIQNQAERLPGQDGEAPGWSFTVAVAGLVLNIAGLLLVTMFRDLPIARTGQGGGSWLRPASNKLTSRDVGR
ncbi:hypothetical protein BsWGS_20963 [Bradybaena similaris]